MPDLLSFGGVTSWLLLVMGAVAAAVFFERLIHYHRERINTVDFINGVRTVLKRGNIVEALSICEATPGPVARLVKAAILVRDRSRDSVRETVKGVSWAELVRLEEKLGVLVVVAQTAPIVGFLGTILGMMNVFHALQTTAVPPTQEHLAEGIWKALVCSALGLAVAAAVVAGYNFLITRLRRIELDMQRASSEITSLLADSGD